jgi:chromosome transmission fidelity protein 18
VRKTEHQLWVDKYEASCYFDLLTPEAQNRNLLTWLKSWDQIVFPERAQQLTTTKIEDSNGA